jgi:hypothetical protein
MKLYVKACPKSKSRRKPSRKWRSSAASVESQHTQLEELIVVKVPKVNEIVPNLRTEVRKHLRTYPTVVREQVSRLRELIAS